MPGDFAVNAAPSASAGAAPAGQAEPIGSAVPAPAPVSPGARQRDARAGPDAAHPSLYANPVSELDPALGIVVLHFYNSEGTQTSSIPTQKQLDSYRLHDGARPGAPGRSSQPASAPDSRAVEANGAAEPATEIASEAPLAARDASRAAGQPADQTDGQRPSQRQSQSEGDPGAGRRS